MFRIMVYTIAMRQRRKAKNMTDQLRKAITASGESLYMIAKNSGVDYSVLLRFTARERGITLDTAAKLAHYLGLELRAVKKGR